MTQRRRPSRAWAVLLVAAALALHAGGPEDAGRAPLGGRLAILEDPGGRLDATGVAQADAQGRFRPVPANISAGYRRDPLWVRLPLSPQATPGERWLEVAAPFLEDVRLYTPRNDGGFDEQRGGRLAPGRGPWGLHRQSVFILGPANPDQGAIPTAYLRVATRSALVIEPVLWRPQAFLIAAQREDLFFGGLFAVCLVILAGGLFNWAKLREGIHLVAGTYVGLILLVMLGTTGYLDLLFQPASSALSPLVYGLALAFLLGAGTSLFLRITSLDLRLPRFAAGYRASAWVLSGCAAAVTAAGHYFRIAAGWQLVLLLATLLNLGLAGWLAARRDAAARLYLLAFGIQLLSYLLRIGRNLAWLPANAATEYGFYLGTLFHVALLNVPVAHHAERLQRERDEARLEALEIRRRAAEDLERQVAERTEALRGEKAEAEQALARSEQLVEQQRQFISMVSHEFRTPLSIIDGAAQTVALKEPPGSALAGPMLRIRKGVRRLIHLLDNSLSQDRIASGKLAFHPVAVDLVAELAGIVERAQASTEQHRIRFESALPALACTCDQGWLAIALQNLLDNAVKYAPDGGDITLQLARAEDDWITVRVRDQGIGVPPDQLEAVFGRYVRGSNVGPVPGAGLGLHIIRHIVEAHGGSIALESRLGEGSTFTLRLPVDPAAG